MKYDLVRNNCCIYFSQMLMLGEGDNKSVYQVLVALEKLCSSGFKTGLDELANLSVSLADRGSSFKHLPLLVEALAKDDPLEECWHIKSELLSLLRDLYGDSATDRALQYRVDFFGFQHWKYSIDPKLFASCRGLENK